MKAYVRPIQERVGAADGQSTKTVGLQNAIEPGTDRTNKAIDSFHFVTAVWGATHRRIFVEVGLPSLLSPGNLPGISALSRSRYHLFTRASDLREIEAAPSFQHLRQTIRVEIDLIDEESELAPHSIMSRCHRKGLRRAYELGAGTVFVPPDCVWANHSMQNLERIARVAARTVHMTGLRLLLEDALPELVGRWGASDGRTLVIPPRELVGLGLRHLHPITKGHFFREQGGKLMPANLLWMVNDEGILAHCFHLHPLLIQPNERNTLFKSTIDDDLALVSDPTAARDYVIQDSDEICTFELSSRTHVVQAFYNKGSVADIAAWAEIGMNSRHRMLIQKPIRIHAGNVIEQQWASVEGEAADVIRNALELVDKPFWYLLLKGLRKNISHRAWAISRNPPEPPPAPQARGNSEISTEDRLARTLDHGAVLLRHYVVTFPLRLRYYAFLTARAFYQLVAGSLRKVRPWHWLYERQVSKPVLSIANSGNRALIICSPGTYVDAGYLSPRTEVIALSSLSAWVTESLSGKALYDTIICLGAPGDVAPNDLPLIGRLLSRGGQLFICVQAPDHATVEKIVHSIPPDLEVCECSSRGSLGTAVLTRIFLRYRPFMRWLREHPSSLVMIARVILMPPLVLLLYPIASITAGVLNLFGRRDGWSAAVLITAKKTRR